MGHSIGLEFALGGFHVHLVDVSDEVLDRSMANIKRGLRTLVDVGAAHEDECERAVGRIRCGTSLDAAAAESDYVVEAVSESLDLKKAIFHDLGRAAPPHAILASNTSGLSVRELAEASGCPERVLITHYWNPPHLLPLVEVVPNEATSPEALKTVRSVLAGLGKKVVVLKKDALGFIGNRLQFAMMREAFSLVEQGIAAPDDVDTVVKYSIGRRLGVLGPFEIADFGGLDVWDSILGYLAQDLDRSTTSPRILADAVKRGHVGVKAGRGFREWPPEKADALREARDRELLRWLLVDRGAGG